jgi:1,4-dihydroxy-2-naphthoate octaprenyltransferase
MFLVILRKPVFKFFEEKLKLKHAPPLVMWLIMLVVSYILVYINSFIQDLTTIFWMGLIGCAIGTVLTFIAENRYGNKEEKKDE